MPFVLHNPSFQPMIDVLEHSFWYPFARLSYGAYLSHCVFMLFRAYNAERGTWACQLDAFLFFFAYLTFSYLFSFLVTVMIEIPCHNLYNEFYLKTKEVSRLDSYYTRGNTTTPQMAVSTIVERQRVRKQF